MKSQFVQVSRGVVNIQTIVEAHWEGAVLFVHFLGGEFQKYLSDDAKLVFEAMAPREEQIND